MNNLQNQKLLWQVVAFASLAIVFLTDTSWIAFLAGISFVSALSLAHTAKIEMAKHRRERFFETIRNNERDINE